MNGEDIKIIDDIKKTVDDIRNAFRCVAIKCEKAGDKISVCDSCEVTYPMRWIIDNTCPFCGGKHNKE